MCDQPLRHQVQVAVRGSPGALILVHLQQPLMDTRVHAPGDESLDLQAFAPGDVHRLHRHREE